MPLATQGYERRRKIFYETDQDKFSSKEDIIRFFRKCPKSKITLLLALF